jgi:hypothetical protein
MIRISHSAAIHLASLVLCVAGPCSSVLSSSTTEEAQATPQLLTVTTTDGAAHRGRLIQNTAQRIVLRVEDGRYVVVPWTRVGARGIHEVAGRGLRADDVSGWHALADRLAVRGRRGANWSLKALQRAQYAARKSQQDTTRAEREALRGWIDASRVRRARAQLWMKLREQFGRPIPTRRLKIGDVPTWRVVQELRKSNPKGRELAGAVAAALLRCEGLIRSSNVDRRLQGLSLAVELVRWLDGHPAQRRLAAMVADVYVMPNLDAAAKDHWLANDLSEVLVIASAAYRSANRTDAWTAAARLRVVGAYNANASQAAWLDLSLAYEQTARYADAVAALEQIDPAGGLRGARDRLKSLQQKLKAQQADPPRRPAK